DAGTDGVESAAWTRSWPRPGCRNTNLLTDPQPVRIYPRVSGNQGGDGNIEALRQGKIGVTGPDRIQHPLARSRAWWSGRSTNLLPNAQSIRMHTRVRLNQLIDSRVAA